MNPWIIIGYSLPLFFSCAIYAFIISPIIYWRWIIPQIERRYCKKLTFHPVHRFDAHPAINKALDLARYITYAYIGHRLKGPYYRALDKFNYDVKTAPKIEIILSISTVCLFYIMGLFMLSGLILIFHDWLTGKG